MTDDKLTIVLAQRIMGWGIGPDRFLTGNRSWLPRWRFRPTERIEDACRLLDFARPDAHYIELAKQGYFSVRIEINGVAGVACDRSRARVISLALARAIEIDLDSSW